MGPYQGLMRTHLLMQYDWITRSEGYGKPVVDRDIKEGEVDTKELVEAYRE